MSTLKTTIVALTALVAASGSALAYSEAGVTQLDVARVSGQIQEISNSDARAQAQNQVEVARDHVQDNDYARAAFALNKALAFANPNQTAELTN